MPETGSHSMQGIVAGDHALTHKGIVVKSGEGALIRGTVLGQVTIGAASSAAKAGGNTGGGTLTLDGTNPVRPGAKAGVYSVRCIAAATNSGTFRVEDPDGVVIGDVVVGATFDDDVKFVLADVGTDFAVGDGFDITVAAGSGKWRVATTAAADGSATPKAILAEDVDATSGDAKGPAYLEGEFAQEMLTYGAGHDAASVEAAFRAASQSIYLRSVGTVP